MKLTKRPYCVWYGMDKTEVVWIKWRLDSAKQFHLAIGDSRECLLGHSYRKLDRLILALVKCSEPVISNI